MFTFPSPQGGITSVITSHTILSLCFHSSTLKAAQQAEITRRLKERKFYHLTSCSVWIANACVSRPVLLWVTVANHKRVECHLLVHNLNPLSSPSPPIHSPSSHRHTGTQLLHTDSPYVFLHTHRENHSLSARSSRTHPESDV